MLGGGTPRLRNPWLAPTVPGKLIAPGTFNVAACNVAACGQCPSRATLSRLLCARFKCRRGQGRTSSFRASGEVVLVQHFFHFAHELGRKEWFFENLSSVHDQFRQFGEF